MISGFLQITPSDARTTSTTKNGVLIGSKAITRDGKVYRWTLNGAVALAAGKTNTGVARVANNSNMALATTSNIAIGSTKISVTLGGTAVTADQYLDGYAVINDGTGVGQSFLLAGNSAQTSGSGTCELYLAEAITAALVITSDTKVTLIPNPNAGVVVTPAVVTNPIAGVPNVAVAASSYFWDQSRGMAGVLSDGVIARGTQGIPSDAVIGALETRVDATVVQPVSFVPDATVDAKYYPQYLLVD
jgi:hypothetical protein